MVFSFKENYMYAGVYVGTHKKYNEGSDNKLDGKWLDMSDYDSYEDFIAACKELHKDEDEPEFMFQDFDFDSEVRPLLKQLVRGSQVDPQAWDVFDLDSDERTYVLATWDNYDSDLSVKEALEKGRESYRGSYDLDPGDYVYDCLEELLMDLPGAVNPNTRELHRTYQFILDLVDLDEAVQAFKYDGYEFIDGCVFYFS